MKIDINSIGYRWKGIYSPLLSYVDGDVVYQNGSVYVYRGGTLQNFALGQQDATLAGYLLAGGVSVGGSWGQVLTSNGASGVQFSFENERGGTIATALLDTYNGMGCNSNNHYMMALMNEGQIRAWGRGNTGQLGIGRSDDVGWSWPQRVAMPSTAPRFVSMHAAWAATYFLGEDGSLWVCGTNSESSTGTGAQRDVPIKLNGYGDLGASVKVTKVFSAYDYYGYQMVGCIDTNGYVYMWGTNNYGACGWGDTSAATYPKIVPWSVSNPCKAVWPSGGNYQACMFVKLDGSAYMAGETNSTGLGGGDRYIPTRFKPWDTDDAVKKYGQNESDAHWAAGSQYYRDWGVLLENGNLYLWGDDGGQVGGGWGDGTTGDSYPSSSGYPKLCLTNVQDFFTKGGGYHSSIALMKDGTVKATGASNYSINNSTSDTTTWATIGGSYLTNGVKLLGLGGTYGAVCALLRSDGKVVCWGMNDSGIAGNGLTTTAPSEMTFVALNKTVIDIQFSGTTYGGNADTALFMLCNDGTVYMTGQGSYGMGGSTAGNNRYAPQQIIF